MDWDKNVSGPITAQLVCLCDTRVKVKSIEGILRNKLDCKLHTQKNTKAYLYMLQGVLALHCRYIIGFQQYFKTHSFTFRYEKGPSNLFSPISSCHCCSMGLNHNPHTVKKGSVYSTPNKRADEVAIPTPFL